MASHHFIEGIIMTKMNAKGRRKNERFVGIPHRIYDHESFKALSANAKAVYLELLRRYHGSNNGEIGLAQRCAGKAIKGSKATGARALAELEQSGFIKMNNKGHYGNRHGTTWILTHQTNNNTSPTNDWQNKC